jgi:hypothetical protein
LQSYQQPPNRTSFVTAARSTRFKIRSLQFAAMLAAGLLGSPTAKGTFDDNTWLYLGSVTRTRVARKQGIVSLDVVKLTFDEGGVLRGIEHLDMDDRLPVSVVARTTPSPGSDASIMQQLFGNIGRFGVGSSGAAAPGGGSAK